MPTLLVSSSLATLSTSGSELPSRRHSNATAVDPRVTGVEEVVYVDEDSRAAIATSRGVSGGYSASVAYSFLQAMATQNSEIQTGLGFGVARSPGDLDAGVIRHRHERHRVRHLGSKCSTLRSAHCHHHRCMQVGAVELS